MPVTLPETPIPDERFTAAQVAVTLITAAALIDEYGLYTGDWWEYDRQHPYTWTPGRKLCAVGALAVASGYRTDAGLLREFTQLYVPARDSRRPGRRSPDPLPHPVLRTVMAWQATTDVEELFAWSDQAYEAGEPERITETFRAIATVLTRTDGAPA